MCLVRSTYFHLLRMARDCRQAMPATIQFAHFDSLNRLHRNKRCRIGEGSSQLHEENNITNYQPNSEVFQHFSPCYFINVPHDFTRFLDAGCTVSQDAARRWLRVLHVTTARRRRQIEASHVMFEALLQETKTKSFEAMNKNREKPQD